MTNNYAPRHAIGSIVDLAALLMDPAQVTELDPAKARSLLAPLAALAFALSVRAATAPPAPPPGDGDGSRNGHEAAVWLNGSQVEAQYGLTPTWLREHARELEQVPNLVSRVSRKGRVYKASVLRRWIEAKGLA
jgi:hypothetical protein